MVAASLHHSSWQCQILNLLSEARDGTHGLMVPSWVRFHCTMMGTPQRNNKTVKLTRVQCLCFHSFPKVELFSSTPFSMVVLYNHDTFRFPPPHSAFCLRFPQPSQYFLKYTFIEVYSLCYEVVWILTNA